MQPAKIGMSFMLLALAALDAASAASLLRHGGRTQGHPRRTSRRKHLPEPKAEDLSAIERLVLDMGNSVRDRNSSASADIQELLSGFEEAINNSYTAAQTMLDNFEESFDNCSDDREYSNTDINGYAVTKGGHSSDHDTCRKKEATQYQALQTCNTTVQSLKTINDNACNAYQSLLKTPSVNLAPAPLDGESYAAWLQRVKNWATNALTELNAKQAACNTAESQYSGNHSACLGTDNSSSTKIVYDAKREECNGIQDTFEAVACSYAAKVDDVCGDYSQCYTAAKNSYDKDLPNLQAAETSRKNEWWMIQRIKCYFDVMTQAGNGNVDNAAMEACKTTSPNTGFLDLKMPEIPNPPEACEKVDKPCSTEFLSDEYSSLSSNSPAKACTPCDGR